MHAENITDGTGWSQRGSGFRAGWFCLRVLYRHFDSLSSRLSFRFSFLVDTFTGEGVNLLQQPAGVRVVHGYETAAIVEHLHLSPPDARRLGSVVPGSDFAGALNAACLAFLACLAFRACLKESDAAGV